MGWHVRKPLSDDLNDVLFTSKAQGDLIYWDAASGKWANIARYDALAQALGAGIFVVLNGQDSTLTVTGTGANLYNSPDCVAVKTGATAGSTARRWWDSIIALGSGSIDYYMNWAKDFDIFAVLHTYAIDANTVLHFHLAKQSTGGILSDLGVGIQITNDNAVLETFGAGGRGTIGSFNIPNNTFGHFRIKKRAGQVDWFVEGVQQTPQTTANLIPATGVTDVNCALCGTNGAGTQDLQVSASAVRIVRAL